MVKKSYPPRARRLLDERGYFRLSAEARIEAQEEFLRVLSDIDAGTGRRRIRCYRISRRYTR